MVSCRHEQLQEWSGSGNLGRKVGCRKGLEVNHVVRKGKRKKPSWLSCNSARYLVGSGTGLAFSFLMVSVSLLSFPICSHYGILVMLL
jgi:hypothetical protein